MDFPALILILLLGICFVQFILIFIFLEKGGKPADLSAGRQDKTEEKSREIIHSAVQKAGEIIGEAEIEGIKTAAATKLRTTGFEKDYEEKLDAAVDKSQRELARIVTEHVNSTLSGFDLKLAQTIAKIEDDRLKSAAARADEAQIEIDKYRNDITAKIDDNIAEILETAIFKIVGKKLTLKDHMEIV
ncbi:MAG: hypothetical protein AAB838_00125, partial [Patescibacteria group bacterium]